MASISIRHTIEQAAQELKQRFSAANIRFGVAKTLTDLAGAIQQEVRGDLPRQFKIRRSWVPNGIRILPASRSSLEAAIYSIDSGGRRDFMGMQQTGGVKVSQTGHHIAIPLKAVKPTPMSIVQQGWKPKALLQSLPATPGMFGGKKRMNMAMKAQAIKVQSRKNPAVEIILMKRGNGYVPAWLLVPSAKIPERDFLTKPGLRVLNRDAARVLRENLIASLKK